MCGIIGIFGNNDSNGRALKALKKITHRGSNVFEVEFFENGALGANRLAIVDRKNGRQPKFNEDKTIFAAQNGEIFNYKKLKKELEDKGHEFATDSDTEVLAHLYEEYGIDMVKKIDSEMFAFVIYDKKNNKVFAARDPLGVKPLYYAHDESGQLYFTSEIKQLTIFPDISEINNFPAGSYYINGKFKKYYDLTSTDELDNEAEVVATLEEKIVKAVAKRVDTDLPIGVLLSGGVDSSLMMEIATRLHPDVTAIILGYPGSPDYEFAIRLCKDRKYKHKIISPKINFGKEIDKVLYHVESYEPNVIRHSFAVDLCAREAHRLGLKIVLVGEGSDELFCGYNEFSNLSGAQINKGSLMLMDNLHAGQLQRVDRMAMKHTIEARIPLLDREVVDYAMRIDGGLKVKRENHQIITKYILRKVAANFLPDYIAWRYKVPFSNGAGMNVGSNFKSQDGDVAKAVLAKKYKKLNDFLAKGFNVNTDEEKYYLSKFDEFGFTKLQSAQKRLVVKEKINELNKSKKTKLLVAEFDRLALYFPVYFAQEMKIFDKHGLNVDFIATGGDDKTYDSLVNNSAHIGLADPMFSMFENSVGVKGKIVGELVTCAPNIAVAINPSIQISRLKDFAKYKIGTFQKFSTTHTLIKYLLPKKTSVMPMAKDDLLSKLSDRTIDIAIVLPEHASSLIARGGRVVFSFNQAVPDMLCSGFTVANILEDRYSKRINDFLAAVRESMNLMLKDKQTAKKIFARLFPLIREGADVFDSYLKMWSPDLIINEKDFIISRNMWKSTYPKLLKQYYPFFIEKK